MQLTLAAVVCTPPAWAEADPNADALARARMHFSQGLEHLDGERWKQAAGSFEAALELRSSAEVRFNLSTALVELGQFSQALSHLEAILDDPTARKRVKKAANASKSELMPRLGRVAIDANEENEILSVSLDGQLYHRELWNQGIPVNPGTHEVKVTRVDAPMAHHRVQVKAGETLRVHLIPHTPDVAPRPSVAAQPVAPLPKPKQRSHGWVWWAAGAAGAALAGVAVLAVQRDSNVVQGSGGHFAIGAP